jgi:hypothetical protein
VSTTVLLATTGRGVARAATQQGDREWSVDVTLADQDVRYLAADPVHPHIVYAGTQGAGVFCPSLVATAHAGPRTRGAVYESVHLKGAARMDTGLLPVLIGSMIVVLLLVALSDLRVVYQYERGVMRFVPESPEAGPPPGLSSDVAPGAELAAPLGAAAALLDTLVTRCLHRSSGPHSSPSWPAHLHLGRRQPRLVQPATKRPYPLRPEAQACQREAPPASAPTPALLPAVAFVSANRLCR